MKTLFFVKNRKKYFDLLSNNSIAVFFSGHALPKSADQDYPFEVNKNFYYLAGITQEESILVLVKGKEGIQEHLFILEHDPIQSKWVGKRLSLEEAIQQSGIEQVHFINQFEDFKYNLLNSTRKTSLGIETLYLDLERRAQSVVKSLAHLFSKEMMKDYPELVIKNTYNDVIMLRMIKSEDEIALIKESIATTKEGIENLVRNIRPKMYEYQIQTFFDSYIKFVGNKSNAFDTICATGKNATVLHYTDNNVKTGAKDLILFDLGCRTEYYVSDITRTYPVNGKFSGRQKVVYEAVLRVNEACIAFLKPGITWNEFNQFANTCLIHELKTLGLIQEDHELVKYYFHSIGHMIGLDTHDPVLRHIPFAPGMVMTVEPGLYLEEEGIGIRIEDNVLITEDGAVNLSVDIIKSVEDIEQLMKES
ncbi:MAG: Xaa-Pro aminopeptidase [Bacilli bacterium]|nr:Xaa-Pro aminopeptidase [Bacilli bacterium]